MTLEYELIFFVSWVIKLVIFQQVSQYKFRRLTFWLLPLVFTLIQYWNYDIIFWGEIFFLPLIALTTKYKEKWNWIQYFFCTFFSLVVDDIFMRVASLYFQFIFRLSIEEIDVALWMDWIPTIFTLPLYYIFLKLVRLDLNLLKKGVKTTSMSKLFKNFNVSLIIYYVIMYILSGLPTIEHEGWITTNFDDIYYRRLVLFSYVPIFIGFLLYINYIARINIDKEIQRVKDEQINALSTYSNHIEALYKDIRSFRHDYTNVLTSLNHAFETDDLASAKTVYQGVLAQSDKKFYASKYDIANLANLTNPAMKSILSAKLMEADNLGLDLTVEIEQVIGTPDMDLLDLITMLSIFLDNAIEAAAQSEQKTLSLAYFAEGDRQVLIIENSTLEARVNTKTIFAYGQSSKGDNRGIGLANVKDILTKYPQVTLLTSSQNHTFRQEVRF